MTNPKDIAGEKKPPLHLIPLNAKIVLSMAMKNGKDKYGPFNWRDLDIQASAYIGAAQRHIDLWWDCGEENAKDSGVHHLGHAMATLAILYDALINGAIIDDRPPPSKASELMDSHTVDMKKTTTVNKPASVGITVPFKPMGPLEMEAAMERLKSHPIIVDPNDSRVTEIEVGPWINREPIKLSDALKDVGTEKEKITSVEDLIDSDRVKPEHRDELKRLQEEFTRLEKQKALEEEESIKQAEEKWGIK